MPGGIDPLDESLALVEEAGRQGIPLRLVGGVAIRFVCPMFPARSSLAGTDIDLASLDWARVGLTRLLEERGYIPHREFNALHGHKQLQFTSPHKQRAVDVLINRLEMCHTLDFGERIDRMPVTLDLCDLLLSKLQIVELNEKDARDVLYLLAAFPVKAGQDQDAISLDRFSEVVGRDWGWWRTVTLNLERIEQMTHDHELAPRNASLDPIHQLRVLARCAEDTPKSWRWKARAAIGARVRWYQLPEDVRGA